MQVERTELPGLVILKPPVHKDERGFFLESFREDTMKSIGATHSFVQDNHACSVSPGVMRGLHYQNPSMAQGKLVWVTRGAVYDVAVDIRVGSPTYGKWYGLVLNAENFLRFFIPRGFAHGYMTLEKNTEVQYKADNYYSPEHDAGIAWNDIDLAIEWPDIYVHLSEKDKAQAFFKDFSSPFVYGES